MTDQYMLLLPRYDGLRDTNYFENHEKHRIMEGNLIAKNQVWSVYSFYIQFTWC